MAQRKKATKKVVKKAPAKQAPVKEEVEVKSGLDKVIEEADAVLLVIEKNGHISIDNLKNVNNAVYAKGMLHSALDLYLIRPVISTLSELHKTITLASGQRKK